MKRNQMIRRAVLCSALVLAVTVLVSSGVFAGRWQNRQNTDQPEMTIPTPQKQRIAARIHVEEPTIPHLALPERKMPKSDYETAPLSEGMTEENVNILLIGHDANAGNGTRADTIILCTFNKQEDTITLTSFLRDLYIKIPGYHKDRINAAYAFGGVELLNKTLQENFGVEVDGNVQVDFDHFEDIIDLLGGVTLELTAAEARWINTHVAGSKMEEGTQLLSGKQALAYVRNRKDSDGDFSRTNRQRKLLRALVQAYKSTKLTKMLSLLDDILPMISTDIPPADLTTYALTLFPMLTSAKIKTQSIPVEEGFRYARVDGKSVLMPDMEKNKQALSDVLT